MDAEKDTERLQRVAKELHTLSTYHTRPSGQGKITFWPNASMLKVSRGCEVSEKEKAKPGKRGCIKEFSQGSRRRMMRGIGAVDKTKGNPVFVTRTFPDKFPPVMECKRLDKIFHQRMRRRWPRVGGINRLEPQHRKAAHFHGLYWGVTEEEFYDFYKWICDTWYQLAGQGDENHLKFLRGELPGSKPCVTRVESWRGVMSYTSKYVAKKQADFGDEKTGRYWAWFHRENIPFATPVEVAVELCKAMDVIRYARRFAKIRGRDYPGLTIMCNANFWAEKLSLISKVKE